MDRPVTKTANDVFRPEHRELDEHEQKAIAEIKKIAAELFTAYEDLNSSRYTSLAKTSLEESVMWATKEITAPVSEQ